MPLGIDPKVDFAFKMVFGNPAHTAITIHFLNAVLKFPQPITAVEILNPIHGRNRSADKLAILDVLATDTQGRRYNIEMQTTLPAGLVQRLTYYNCLNYVKQLRSGRRYEKLRPAISICVLDRVLFAETSEYYLSFQLRSDQTPELLFNPDFRFYLLELPKYHAAAHNMERLGPLEKWLYFLKHAASSNLESLAEQLADDEFREAVGVLEMISESPEDRDYYEARLKFAEMDRIALREEGREEGLQQGLAEGRQKGREEAMEEARREGLTVAIQALQEIIGDAGVTKPDLLNRSSEQLAALLSNLQQRLRSRGV